jgi:glycine/D-amino acid oxidase-like deaminating enzyme
LQNEVPKDGTKPGGQGSEIPSTMPEDAVQNFGKQGLSSAFSTQMTPNSRTCAVAARPAFQPSVEKVSSSWAIATKPQPQKIWKGGALIWEDSQNYHYARTTSAGRIIIGGEDSDQVIEPDARDRLIPQKARALARKPAALWPVADPAIEFRWSGTFDTTNDGLPLIGPVPGAKGIYAAYGYGGNGITFSFLAARLIGDLIAGSSSTLVNDFALDRDGRSIGR